MRGEGCQVGPNQGFGFLSEPRSNSQINLVRERGCLFMGIMEYWNAEAFQSLSQPPPRAVRKELPGSTMGLFSWTETACSLCGTHGALQRRLRIRCKNGRCRNFDPALAPRDPPRASAEPPAGGGDATEFDRKTCFADRQVSRSERGHSRSLQPAPRAAVAASRPGDGSGRRLYDDKRATGCRPTAWPCGRRRPPG